MTRVENGATRPSVIVTGGSRGIGAATVRELAAQGYNVAFCYESNESAAKSVAESIDGSSSIFYAKVNVRNESDVQQFVASVSDRFGSLAGLVTCAGITRDRPLALMSSQEWSTVIETNLDGVFNFCKAVTLPMMRERRGSVVLLGSVAGQYGNVGQTNYAASKAGIEGFGKSMAKELAGRGIRVNVVAPGFIDTDMTRDLPEAARDRAVKEIPMKRLGEADEIARLIRFLVSDDSSYVTGQVIGINGGLTL